MTVTEDRPAAGATPPPNQDSSSGGGISYVVFGVMSVIIVLALLGVLAVGLIALVTDDGGSAADGTSSELDISLTEFSIDGELSATEGDVTLNVVNAGSLEHNLAVRELGVQTANMTSRGVDTLALGELEAGTYEVFCSISGHAESGMVNELVIVPEGEEVAAGGDDHADFTPEEMEELVTRPIEQALSSVTGVEEVTSASVEITWDPPWDPDMMSDAAKLELGMY